MAWKNYISFLVNMPENFKTIYVKIAIFKRVIVIKQPFYDWIKRNIYIAAANFNGLNLYFFERTTMFTENLVYLYHNQSFNRYMSVNCT